MYCLVILEILFDRRHKWRTRPTFRWWHTGQRLPWCWVWSYSRWRESWTTRSGWWAGWGQSRARLAVSQKDFLTISPQCLQFFIWDLLSCHFFLSIQIQTFMTCTSMWTQLVLFSEYSSLLIGQFICFRWGGGGANPEGGPWEESVYTAGYTGNRLPWTPPVRHPCGGVYGEHC